MDRRKSQLSVGLTGLLEKTEEKQAGATEGPAPVSAGHCSLGSISLWPEMTWPGQWSCQENTAARDRRAWLDKQVADGTSIFLEHHFPVTPRGHTPAAAVHPCPHSECGPRRPDPDQLGHQLSGPG